MSFVPSKPPPPEDEDSLLSSLVASASIATPAMAGAPVLSTGAPGGDTGQISFMPTTSDTLALSTSTSTPKKTSTDLSGFGDFASTSKFGITVLSEEIAQEKLFLCLGIKRGGGQHLLH